MATDFDLRHGTGNKTENQKIPERLFDVLYQQLQEPEYIFQERVPGKASRERIFYFVKDTKDGKKIKIIVHVHLEKRSNVHARADYGIR
jgi:hypothetical protein